MSDAELQRIADKEVLDIGHTTWFYRLGKKWRETAEAEQGPGHNVRRAAARKRTQARELKAAQESIAKRVRSRKAKKVNKNLRTSDTY